MALFRYFSVKKYGPTGDKGGEAMLYWGENIRGSSSNNNKCSTFQSIRWLGDRLQSTAGTLCTRASHWRFAAQRTVERAEVARRLLLSASFFPRPRAAAVQQQPASFSLILCPPSSPFPRLIVHVMCLGSTSFLVLAGRIRKSPGKDIHIGTFPSLTLQ